MDVVKVLPGPMCRWCWDFLKFGINGCHCKSGCTECENQQIDSDAEEYKQRREELDQLRAEIEAAIDRCQRKL